MTDRAAHGSLLGRIGFMFTALAAIVAGLMGTYWLFALEPWLRAEAEAHTHTLVQSHAQYLADSLMASRHVGHPRELIIAMDKVLLLHDSTGRPLVRRLELEVDYEVVPAPPGSLDLVRGGATCDDCFLGEAPLFARQSKELLGLVRFYVSSHFFQRLRGDLRARLALAATVILVLLVLAWRGVAVLLQPPGILAAHLQDPRGEMTRLVPAPGGVVSSEIHALRSAPNDWPVSVEDRTRALRSQAQIIDEIHDAVVSADLEGIVLTWNRGAERLLGYSSEEALGRDVTFIFPEAQRAGWQEQVLGPLERQGTHEFETRLLRKTGGDFYAHVALSARRDEKGRVTGFVGYAMDVTQRRLAEQALRHLNEELEKRVDERTRELRDTQERLLRQERLTTLGRLTGTVAHELRNPLGAIRTSVALLDEKVRGHVEGVARPLDRVKRGIERCDRIISELLDFARTRSVERASTRFDVWLAELLEEHTVPVDVRLRQKLRCPELTLSIDPYRLSRAITNLIDNACQSFDGALSNGSRPREVTVTTVAREGRLELTVCDTGQGMPPDVRPKVFEPLFSTKPFGVGLGLSTVRQIVHEHQGGIEILSSQDLGTEVTVWLPIPESRPGGGR